MLNRSVTPPSCDHAMSLSLVPRRSRHSGCEVIVERVVEKATAAIVYPVLTHTNYVEWSLLMRVNLHAAGFW
jgi:hypothetical protein